MDLFNKVSYCLITILLIILMFLSLYMIYLNFKSYLQETYNEDNKNIFYRLLLRIHNID
jgi:hypothetical protein